MTPRILAIIQARMGSSRFPGKSMAEIDGRPILTYMLEQLSYCRTLDGVILAIPDVPSDDTLADFATGQGWSVFRGSEADVLDRFYQAATLHKAGPRTGIVRLTGDDILPDPYLVDAVSDLYSAFDGLYDYVCTDRAGRLPYGAGIELLSYETLGIAHREAEKPHDREHVVPFVKWNADRFKSLELTSSTDFSDSISLSIDTPDDLARCAALIADLQQHHTPPYHIADILAGAARMAS
jgi:spore coat polysaccharide biosynthesis protein SpsF (cytidylyltransferase family)